MSNNQLPAILTADEVADLMRVNRKTVYEAVKRGEIPGVVKVGRSLRFSRDELLRWLCQGRAVPTQKG